jgi:hypothetical protein
MGSNSRADRVLTFDGFNELDSFIAAILNRLKAKAGRQITRPAIDL